MQGNSCLTVVNNTSSIGIEQECCPVYISSTTENKWFIQRIRRQEELQWRSLSLETRYDRNRKRRGQAALRINHHSPSPIQQDHIQRSRSPAHQPGHPSRAHEMSIVTQSNYLSTSVNDCSKINNNRQPFISDDEAYARVEQRFRQKRETRFGRTLRKRLNHELELRLSCDIDSLDAILIAADKLFFSRRLHKHVTWRWSCESDQGFTTEFVGTTTPLYLEDGVRTEIVLSKPLLQSGEYSSNLLLSAFLHELVHCYLFICCGTKAEKDGGHTPGFKKIVSLIQSWLGNSRLQLCSMRADLGNFLPAEEEHREDGCCSRLMEVDTIYYGAEEDPVYSDFSNSPMRAGDSGIYQDGLKEVVQTEPEWTLTKDDVPTWDDSREQIDWAGTPRMTYVSRQERELADAIEGL